MQQVSHCIGFKQTLVPSYHPEANLVERNNRDLKTQIAIHVANDHTRWKEKLLAMRFAIKTATSQATGYTPAYLTFGRDLRTPDDVHRDFRAIMVNENFTYQITPYLKLLATTLQAAREKREVQQDRSKKYSDLKRRTPRDYHVGDHELLATHPLSGAKHSYTAKFAPKRDGPYLIFRVFSPTTYEITTLQEPPVVLGKYHDITSHRISHPTKPRHKLNQSQTQYGPSGHAVDPKVTLPSPQ